MNFDSEPLRENNTKPEEMEEGAGLLAQEGEALHRAQVIGFIAEVSHQTWMRQRAESKGESMESLSPNISDGDRERAQDAWETLKKERPKTKLEAIDLLTKRSHEMWLASKRTQEPGKEFNPNPNSHDRERAEDIVNALGSMEILSFEGK